MGHLMMTSNQGRIQEGDGLTINYLMDFICDRPPLVKALEDSFI